MEENIVCPLCAFESCYSDGSLMVCPACGHEWDNSEELADNEITKDCNGTQLLDGDDVTLIKDLKVKGSSIVLKRGTKIKGIKLTDNRDEVDCRADGMEVVLKTCFLKKG